MTPEGRGHRRWCTSTSVPATELDAEHTVRAYKRRRACVPQPQDGGPESRPIHGRPRARPRLSVFAYYVDRGICASGSNRCCDDEEPDVAEAARPSVVAPADVSPSAQDARRKRTASGEPVHSFRTLLDDLATVANNRVVTPLARQALRPHHSTDCAAAQSLQAAWGSSGTYGAVSFRKTTGSGRQRVAQHPVGRICGPARTERQR